MEQQKKNVKPINTKEKVQVRRKRHKEIEEKTGSEK